MERKAETKLSKDLSHFKDNIKCLSGNYGTKKYLRKWVAYSGLYFETAMNNCVPPS